MKPTIRTAHSLINRGTRKDDARSGVIARVVVCGREKFFGQTCMRLSFLFFIL